MQNLLSISSSDFIAIMAIIVGIILTYITIKVSNKYKPSLPTDSEIQFVIQFLDFLSKYKLLLCYYKNDFPQNYRRVFTIDGDIFKIATIKNKVENQIDNSVLNYFLIINSAYFNKNIANEFISNRFLAKNVKNILYQLELKQFDKHRFTREDLYNIKSNFLLLDSKNPLIIHIGKGAVPYRRIAIRDFSYSYVLYRNNKMTARQFKSILETLDREIKKWLTARGLKHFYQNKISQLNLSSIEEIIDQTQNKIDKELSIDIFSVVKDSPIYKEIQALGIDQNES
ncbi:MAG TPA: hypothetical protein PLP23_15605 [Panacibacter sp.]|nr:hypothetical protein [Panacibacter sp.]